MQLYKGLQKIIPERIQYCIQQMCTIFFKYVCKQSHEKKNPDYDVNKKNHFLKIKKNHKAQNQILQARVRDELRQ